MGNCRKIINSISGIFDHGMSSQRSCTPSTDSDASTKADDLVFSKTDSMVGKIKDRMVLKRAAVMLGSKKLPYYEEVLEKGCDKWALVDYRGTMTRPLTYFGKCKVKTETEKLPWISDNTSGKVHPDMRTISMLYNEDLTLPKVAESFIAQSSVLQEEARWERLKAAFYSFYPEDVKKKVFKVLSKMLLRDASQIIAMKTLRFENEIVFKLRPKPSDQWAVTGSSSESDPECCSEDDAAKLNDQIPELAREYRKKIEWTLKRCESSRKTLSTYNSFLGEETLLYDGDTKSKGWNKKVTKYHQAIRECMKSRPLSYHLDHAVARYDPRTGWIHLKTQLLRPGLEENRNLPKEIFEFKLQPKYKIEGSVQAQNAAVDTQMALFEAELRNLSTGHLATLDSYHNDISFHEYEVSIPYETIKPSLCRAIVKEMLAKGWDWNDFQIASQPGVLHYEKLHYNLKVYAGTCQERVSNYWKTFYATAWYKYRYGCCRNCFSKDHMLVTCNHPVYGFAHPVKVKK